MDRKIAKLWVKALRSGKYKQAKMQLRSQRPSGTAFCCLGVLCNLHAEAHPEIAAKETNRQAYLGYSTALPGAVKEWAGMRSSVGSTAIGAPLLTVGRRDFYALELINDGTDIGFEGIADVIEKHVDKL